jgi:outer membrane protein OmpA-like peptidoglycan-associated protein
MRPEPESNDRDEYFISMTDMMVGMVFLFIIMLMFFALKFENAADKTAGVVKTIEATETIRDSILDKIKQDMAEKGYLVQVNPSRGALSLPENLLFEKGRSDLMPMGEASIQELSRVLYQNLLCYTSGSNDPLAADCVPTLHSVEAVLIEGHTDSDGDPTVNWDLSVKRSFATYRALITATPALDILVNKESQPIFSVAGYGRQRPVVPNTTVENKARNRRVDIRLIMLPPKSTDLEPPP